MRHLEFRCINQFDTRGASVLIMVIFILALMVTMATSFLSMVGRKMGTAVNVAAQTRSDVAVQQAQAHVIKSVFETMHATYNKNGDLVPYSTMLNPSWRTEFASITDPDGNPFTIDGQPMPAGTRSTISASSSLVFKHPLVNSDYSLLDMTGGPSGDHYGPTYGFHHL